MQRTSFLDEHLELTRRYFLQAGMLGFAASQLAKVGLAEEPNAALAKPVKPPHGGVRPEPYFTPTADFQDVSRGKPVPHTLPLEKLEEVGLTRASWRLEVLSDPDHPAKLEAI